MAVLPILTQEAPILRQKAKRVARVDDSIRKLIDDMVETMIAAPGVGLAAPQVGVGWRVIVFKTDQNLHTLVNPEMVKSDGEQTGLAQGSPVHVFLPPDALRVLGGEKRDVPVAPEDGSLVAS